MSFQSRIERHQRLFTRMAESQGIDLGLELQQSTLSPDDHHDAVLSCTGCSQPSRCAEDLDRGHGEVPDYCRNAALIGRLAID